MFKLIIWALAGVVYLGFISTISKERAKRYMLLYLAFSIIMLVLAYNYAVPVLDYFGNLLEDNPDWHCGQEGMETQCNGSMIIGGLLLLSVSLWNLFIAPFIVMLATIKQSFSMKKA